MSLSLNKGIVKRLLILSIGLPLLFPVVLSAQEWLNICSPGTSIYNRYDLQQRGLRWDSVYSPGNFDTVFLSFPNARRIEGEVCIEIDAGGILGREVVKKSTGWFWFFNVNEDTIFFNALAGINDSWEMFSLENGDYIQATVLIQYNDTVLGIVDSTKVIQLQAKNSNNVNIPHIFNQKFIQLSQDYGFTQIYDLRYFPEDTNTHILVGKTNPQLGMQQISWAEVFTFDIGDEFHYYGHAGFYVGGGETSYTIKKVLEKILYGNDSVSYQMEVCESATYYGPGGSTTTTYHDTTWIKYILHGVNPLSTFDQLPQSFFPYSSWAAHKYNWYHNQFQGRRLKEIEDNAYGFSEYQYNCWIQLFGWEYPIHIKQFTDGLGLTRDDYECYGPTGWFNRESLVYYKKGSETWGTPVSTDCTTLVPVEDNPDRLELQVSIYPNPASDFITIEIPTQSQISILNLNGQEVLEQTTTEPRTVVDISTLPNGLYFVRVRGEMIVGLGKFVKQ